MVISSLRTRAAMNVDSSDLADSIDRRTVRSVAKVLLAAVSLALVLYLATLLPGVDRLLPGTPVTYAAIVSAIVTAVLVTLLFFVAPKFASLTRMALDGPKVVVENLASVVYWLVVLAAILVAHRGFAGAVVPVFGGIGWLYDAIFLVAALPAVAFVAVRLYSSLDPGADLIADRIAGD